MVTTRCECSCSLDTGTVPRNRLNHTRLDSKLNLILAPIRLHLSINTGRQLRVEEQCPIPQKKRRLHGVGNPTTLDTQLQKMETTACVQLPMWDVLSAGICTNEADLWFRHERFTTHIRTVRRRETDQVAEYFWMRPRISSQKGVFRPNVKFYSCSHKSLGPSIAASSTA